MSRRPPRSNPDPIDKYVGSRVRARRMGIRLSQTALGDAIDITFQQIQKYENGTNRIGASNLYKIARRLGVEVAYFFKDMPEDLYDASLKDPFGEKDATFECFDNDPMTARDSVALVHDYQRIPDDKLREKMANLMRSISQSLNGEQSTDEEE